MSRTLTVVAVAAIFTPTVANASRWIAIDAPPGSARYIDADAIVRDNAVATIWLKTEYENPGKKGTAVVLEKWMHDCAFRRAKLLALTRYRSDGRVINSAELPHYDLDWAAIVSGSWGERVHSSVCANERPEAQPVDNNSPMRSSALADWIYFESGAVKIPANTRSGYCLKTPYGYQGTGAVETPAITGALPRCLDDSGRVEDQNDSPLRRK